MALQVRQNTGTLRLAAQQSAIESLREMYRTLLEGDRLRIFRIGIEDPDALDEGERARFVILVMDMLRALESVYFTHLQGMLGPGVWEGWQRVLQDYSVAPGVRYYWELRKDIFSDAFRESVDSLDEREGALRISDLALRQSASDGD